MTFLLIAQIVVAVLITGAVLIQSQGGGLGASFGASSYHTKRGLEKGIFGFTIFLITAFTLISILVLV